MDNSSSYILCIHICCHSHSTHISPFKLTKTLDGFHSPTKSINNSTKISNSPLKTICQNCLSVYMPSLHTNLVLRGPLLMQREGCFMVICHRFELLKQLHQDVVRHSTFSPPMTMQWSAECCQDSSKAFAHLPSLSPQWREFSCILLPKRRHSKRCKGLKPSRHKHILYYDL